MTGIKPINGRVFFNPVKGKTNGCRWHVRDLEHENQAICGHDKDNYCLSDRPDEEFRICRNCVRSEKLCRNLKQMREKGLTCAADLIEKQKSGR